MRDFTVVVSGVVNQRRQDAVTAAIGRLLHNRGAHVELEDSGSGYNALALSVADDVFLRLMGLGAPERAKAEKLTLDTLDVQKFIAPVWNLGKRFRHSGNGKVYVVTGFAWMGEDDEWGFLHRETNAPGAVPICRPLAHLWGLRANGEPRYQPLTEDDLDGLEHDGRTKDQRDGKGWKVIGADNFNRETVADFVVAENVRSETDAKCMAEGLNSCNQSNTYYKAVPHDYRLCAGMLDLV